MMTSLRILVVEKDVEVRRKFEALLVSEQHSVSVASGPEEALELVQLTKPDAIFSALVFRDMHGFELCRRLRAMEATENKLIVALTIFPAEGDKQTFLDAGFDSYLLKPVKRLELLSILNTRTAG